MTMQKLCQVYGTEHGFDTCADLTVYTCSPLVASSTKVISEAARNTLHQVVHATSRGYQACLDRFAQGLMTSKSVPLRLECVLLLRECLDQWDDAFLARASNEKLFHNAIKKGVCDADAEVRSTSRNMFPSFAMVFNEGARKLLEEMEPDDRSRLVALLPESEVEALIGNKPQKSLLGSVKTCTPHHRQLQHKSSQGATLTRRTPVRQAKSVSFQMVTEPPASRKPFQNLSTNTPTPAKKVKPMFDCATTATKPKTARMGSDTPAFPTTGKKKRPGHERLCRAITECLASGEGSEGRVQRVHCMQELASVFIQQGSSLNESDFASAVHVIDSCVRSSDNALSETAMDAFGTFVFATAEFTYDWNIHRLLVGLVQKCLPVILRKYQDTELQSAASRAVSSCAENLPHNELLSIVLAQSDHTMLERFIALTHANEEAASSRPGTPRSVCRDQTTPQCQFNVGKTLSFQS